LYSASDPWISSESRTISTFTSSPSNHGIVALLDLRQQPFR
jgi:hypothetical protein